MKQFRSVLFAIIITALLTGTWMTPAYAGDVRLREQTILEPDESAAEEIYAQTEQKTEQASEPDLFFIEDNKDEAPAEADSSEMMKAGTDPAEIPDAANSDLPETSETGSESAETPEADTESAETSEGAGTDFSETPDADTVPAETDPALTESAEEESGISEDIRQTDISQSGEEEIKIAFFGDSITAGIDGNNGQQAETSYPTYLEDYFRARCDVYSVGNSGWLPAEGEAAVYDLLVSADVGTYDYLIFSLGTYDSAFAEFYGTAEDDPGEETVMGSFHQCMLYLQQNFPDIPVLLIAPWQTYDDPQTALTELLKTGADSYDISFFSQEDNPLILQGLSAENLPDGLHPSQEGYYQIGEWIAGKLQEKIGLQKREPIPLKSVVLKHASMAYTGSARTQTGAAVVTAQAGSKSVLKNGLDFKVSYKNNINTGTATMIVSGRGHYTGTIRKSFTITPITVKKVILKHSALNYTGIARTQTGSTVVKAYVAGKWKVLERNTDYTVSYKNNINAGTAQLIVKGKGNYCGTIKTDFQIRKVPLMSATVKYATMDYTGKARTQTKAARVYARVNGKKKRLELGTDYSVSYKNNYYGKATMIIKGKGNFYGTIKKTFTITADWDRYKTNRYSPRAEEFSRLCQNLPINPDDPSGRVFTAFSSRITGSVVIPGIKRTHIVGKNDAHTSCNNMIPQGICFAQGYLLISAYCYDQKHGSVIYVTRNGQYVETINLLDENGNLLKIHAGGIAYLNGKVYIAGDTNRCVYTIPFEKIQTGLGRQDARRIRAEKAFYTQRDASFLTAYDGKLYVGTFYMDEYKQATANSTLRAYDPASGNASGAEITLLSNTVQGAAFLKKDGKVYLLMSSSYGRGNASELICALWDKGSILTECKRIYMPNMSEELAFSGTELFIGFESAAREYTGGWFQNLIRPLDRVISIDYRSLLQ